MRLYLSERSVTPSASATEVSDVRSVKPKKQGGAVLIVGLVILLSLTLLGLSAIDSSILETRMATNAQQSQLAFESSESALRAGEEWVATVAMATDGQDRIVTPAFDGTNGRYALRPDIPGVVTPVNFDVLDPTDGSNGWLNGSGRGVEVPLAGPMSAEVPRSPRYIVEYLGRTIQTAQGAKRNLTVLNPTAAASDPREYAFRVTAVGWGRDTKAYRVVQSTIRRRVP